MGVEGQNLKDLPLEERVRRFKTMVQAIGIGVGGDAEYDLRRLGNLIVEYQDLRTDDERDKFKEEKISPMYDKLGEAGKSNPKVAEAVVSVEMAEIGLF